MSEYKVLKSEIETLDLRAEAYKYQSIFSVPTTEQIQDIPFSHAETEQIPSALKQVEKKIIDKFDPTPEQLGFVQYKLSYVVSKAKEGCPRMDWVNILVGVLTSIAVALSHSPEQAHRLWEFCKEALGSAVRLSG
jgi:hypothetical protein